LCLGDETSSLNAVGQATCLSHIFFLEEVEVSSATPDHIVEAVWNNSRGIGAGPVVTRQEWKDVCQDLGGWFSYWGSMIDMKAVSIGGGMYRIEGTKR